MTRAVRRASPFLVALWVLLAAPIHSSAQTTALYLDSQPGDYIGQGERQTITPGAIVFTASQSDPLIDDVVITAQTSNFSTVWRTWFVPPEGLSLAPGLYENTSRSQLDVSGMGRGCGGSNGRFHVYEIEYDETGTLTRFAADFEQHCEGQIPALFGAVRFNSTRASLVPFDGAYPVYSLTVTPASNGYVIGPEIDCGAGRVECVQTYTPGTVVALTPVATTGYLFLGWAGDCLGEHTATVAITRRRFCTPVFAAAPATGLPEVPDYSDGFFFIQGLTRDLEGIPDGPTRLAYLGLSPTSPVRSIIEPTRYRYSSAERALLTVKGPDGTTLELLFAAPSGSVLSPGDYLYTSSASDPSPVPMLAVGGACTQGGRFRLYEYSHDSQTGAVTTFAADFECGPNIAGTIRYRSTRKSLLPFDGNYPLHSLQVVPTAGGYVIGIGIACADGGTIDCTETYGSSTAVSLQAIASAGYEFVAWTGHCTGSQSTTTVLVDAATRCFAVFVPTRDGGAPDNPLFAASTLFIDSLGSAANRSIWLGQDSGVTTRVWPNAVNLTFTPVGSGSTATISFAVSDGVLALGDFEEQYEPAFGFSLSGCYGSVARFRIYEMTIDSAGRLLTFAADFEALCTRMVGQPHLVGAVRFNSQRPRIVPFDGEFPLTKLIIQPTVNGIVTAAGIDCGPASSDCVEIFGAPANAVLTATPLDGYRFIGWSGACRGEGTTTVAVSWIRTCTAVFNAIIPGTGIEDPRIRDRALMIDSQPGDNVGLGQRAILLDTNISAGHFSRSRISVLIETIDRTLWSIELQAPSGQELQAGIYASAIDVSSAKGSPGIPCPIVLECLLVIDSSRWALHHLRGRVRLEHVFRGDLAGRRL
jgi:hypothetical protein